MQQHRLAKAGIVADRIFAGFLEQDSPIGEELRTKDRRGFWLYVNDATGPRVPFIDQIGIIGDDRNSACRGFAEEKFTRLKQNRHHRRSYESRDPDNNKWGGAIRGNDMIASVSGLPELLDEVVSAMVLVALKEAAFSDMVKLLDGNSYIEKIGRLRLFNLVCG